MTIKIDTKDVERWLRATEQRTQAKRLAMTLIGTETASMVQKQASTISATGQLANSINAVSNERKVSIYSAGYGDIALEYGRRPGAMPNPEALKRWCKLKLGDEKLAFVVARKIASSGTDKYRQGGPKLLTDYVLKWISNVLLPQKLDKLMDDYLR